MLKKGWVIGLMLAGICVSSQSVLGMESKSDKCIITENNTDEIVSFLNENVKENLNYNDEAAEQWKYLVAKGYIYMDSDGHLKLQQVEDGIEALSLDIYRKQLDNWNLGLDLHVLEWDEKAKMLYTPEITADVLDNVTDILLENEADNAEPLEDISRGIAHNCNYAKWNIGTTCAQNYNIIKKFYNSLLVAQQPNSGVNPWISTATYWVGFVREGGAWDYKVQKNYQTFCCTFGGVSGQDRSAEWIGNYNYGYTGKFLFDLNTLHMGSYVVSGMDPKDKTTDWPAIDKGYSHAP